MPEKKSLLSRFGTELGAAISDIANGAIDLMADKVIPQGAAELSQALNGQSNAYVPYGTAQQPLDVEGPQQSYQAMLRSYAERGAQEQGQDVGVDR